jgi:hypothetical protein
LFKSGGISSLSTISIRASDFALPEQRKIVGILMQARSAFFCFRAVTRGAMLLETGHQLSQRLCARTLRARDDESEREQRADMRG